MSTELRGRVKERVWLKPYCTDESDTLSAGRQARRDFWRDCQEEEEGPFDVIAPDVFDEAFEMLDMLSAVYK